MFGATFCLGAASLSSVEFMLGKLFSSFVMSFSWSVTMLSRVHRVLVQ